MNTPPIVAHRGDAKRYPENTLAAIEAAVNAGARYVEFDVQLTADGVPVLLHDTDLQRTAGRPGSIFDMNSADATAVSVGEPQRFGAAAFSHVTISTLATVMEHLRAWPGVTAFVEIKEESLARFGTEKVIKTLMSVLKPALDQCVVISGHTLALRCARAMGAHTVGWVCPAWSEVTRVQASELVPDYIFINYTKLPPADVPLWRGPWRWATYEVTDAEVAVQLAGRGVDMIETMAVAELLEQVPLKIREAEERAAVAAAAALAAIKRAPPRPFVKKVPKRKTVAAAKVAKTVIVAPVPMPVIAKAKTPAKMVAKKTTVKKSSPVKAAAKAVAKKKAPVPKKATRTAVAVKGAKAPAKKKVVIKAAAAKKKAAAKKTTTKKLVGKKAVAKKRATPKVPPKATRGKAVARKTVAKKAGKTKKAKSRR